MALYQDLVVGYVEDASPDSFDDLEEADLGEVELRDVVAQFKPNTRLLRNVSEVQRCIYPERRDDDLEKCPDAKEWTKEILSSNREAAASLLVAMLPNLQKVTRG